MTERGGEVADAIIRQLRWLTVAVLLCLALSVSVGVFAIAQSIKVANDSDRTVAALCTFRADLQSRVDQTERFLVDHPKGFAGIPRATLQQSADGQRRTIVALRSLQCPPPTPTSTG